MHVSVGIFHYFEKYLHNTYLYLLILAICQYLTTICEYFLNGSCLCKLNWLGVQGKTQEAQSEAGSHRIDFIPIYFSSGNGRVVISMRRRAAPFGPSSVRSLGLVAFFLSNIGIMPTTIQLPGSERTSSSIQPKDTVTTNVSSA